MNTSRSSRCIPPVPQPLPQQQHQIRSAYVVVLTQDGPVRAPRNAFLAAWADAPRYCTETADGTVIVDCFRAFPSFPVEAGLMACTRGDNALFWMLLRRLDTAYDALHGDNAAIPPLPDTNSEGYAGLLRAYAGVLVPVLFLLATCRRLGLRWNESAMVEKLSSQLSLRTLPLVYDAVARFRYGGGASTLLLLRACHARYEADGWRFNGEEAERLAAADATYARLERETATHAAVPQMRQAPAVPSTPAATVVATEGTPSPAKPWQGTQPAVKEEAATVAALEARLRELDAETEAFARQAEAEYAAALERRLAETADCLDAAHNRVCALEAGMKAARTVTTNTTSVGNRSAPDARVADETNPAVDPEAKVYAAAMIAARDDLERYYAEMRAALTAVRDGGSTPQERAERLAHMFELAATRETSSRVRYEQEVVTMSAAVREKARAIATVRQQLAVALEQIAETA